MWLLGDMSLVHVRVCAAVEKEHPTRKYCRSKMHLEHGAGMSPSDVGGCGLTIAAAGGGGNAAVGGQCSDNEGNLHKMRMQFLLVGS